MNHQARPSTRNAWCALCVSLAMSLALAGCEGPGFVAYVLKGPDKVKALYTLTKDKTLVIVDDPSRVMGDPNLPAVIGANVGFHLDQNNVLHDGQVVPPDLLSGLAARMGDDYFATPIDQIGAKLQADQVIHVLVRSVNMRVSADYYRPSAVVEVKVVDVHGGGRLFPKASDATLWQARPPGIMLNVQLPHQTVDSGRRDTGTLVARQLAERIGLKVAQLFYNHQKQDPL